MEIIKVNDDEKLGRWMGLAERSLPVSQICIQVKRNGVTEAALMSESGLVLARGMHVLEAAFYAEARSAMLAVIDELQTRRAYADYVAEVVELANKIVSESAQPALPLPYPEWVKERQKGWQP